MSVKRAILALLALAVAGSASGADPGRAHPHQGVLPPFEPVPPEVALDAEQRASLARGEAVLTQLKARGGGRGMAVQDIAAPPSIVLGRIADFRAYPRMVKHVRECVPYLEEGEEVRVRFVLRVLGLRYEYYVRHVFRPAKGYITWTLDYSRESDLDDSVGYWYVTRHPTRPGWARLFYAVDMRTRGWMPGLLRSFIATKGLRDATGWVKREAEALQREHDPGHASQARVSSK